MINRFILSNGLNRVDRITASSGTRSLSSFSSFPTTSACSYSYIHRSNPTTRQNNLHHSISTSSIPNSFHGRISPFRFSTSSIVKNQDFEQSKLSSQEYHKVADDTLDILTECFEILLESDQTGQDWDLEVASGVMNFRLGENGTYVINKQPPNGQIWLSSPLSGPLRFDYSSPHRTWFSTKEGRETITLKGILEKELKDIFGEFEFDGDF